MTTDYKITELFCIIDEFCKHFDAENAGNLLEDNSGVKRSRRQASLGRVGRVSCLCCRRLQPRSWVCIRCRLHSQLLCACHK